MIEFVAVFIMFVGLFFIMTGAVGVLRFRDIYLRIHAASKAGTLGFALFIFGAALLSFYNQPNPQVLVKAALAIIFQFLTAPVAAHMIARVALEKGVRPIKSPDEAPQQF